MAKIADILAWSPELESCAPCFIVFSIAVISRSGTVENIYVTSK